MLQIEYYFQIINNLKQDLILGLNFHKTFEILQDITDENDLYLHIRNKIITFSTQAVNAKNYINTCKCMQIKPRSWKKFEVDAVKGLKGGEVYEIDYNTKGISKDVIPVLDTSLQRNTKNQLAAMQQQQNVSPDSQKVEVIMTICANILTFLDTQW